MRSIPKVVQLPGGVRLSGVRFKVLKSHDDGSPQVFEIQPPSSSEPERDEWVLFADEDAIRRPRNT